MSENLPRLGSAEAPDRPEHTEEVEIPDRGVSVVLRKPSVGVIVDLQQDTDVDTKDARKAFESTVGLVAKMLVEPDFAEEQLRVEVEDWSFDDWQTLQAAAMKLAGLSKEDQDAAASEFQEPRD